MKITLAFLCSILVGFIHAQPFQPDTYGKVSGEAFKKFCDQRGYSLVGTFEKLNGSKEGKAASVIKRGTWLYIDLNGKEYQSYTELAKEYGMRMPERERFWDDNMPVDYQELKPIYPKGYKPKYTGQFQKGYKWGYKYEDRVVVQPIYDQVNNLLVNEDFRYYKVRNGDLYGLCDYKGTLITPVVYEYIEVLPRSSSGCTFLVQQNNKKGVLSRGGKVTLEPQFDIIRQENVGLDFVLFTMINLKLGAALSTGKHVVAEEYDDLHFAAVEDVLYGFLAKKNGKTGFLNKQGKELIAPQYEKLGYDQKNFLTHRTETGVGAIDSTGKQLLPPIYYSLYKPLNSNCILVTTRESRLIGIVDLAGNWIDEPRYISVETMNSDNRSNLYVFNAQNGDFHKGIYNTQSLKWVLSCEYKIYFNNSFTTVEQQQENSLPLVGIMGKNGTFWIPLKYQNVRYVLEKGHAVASSGGKFGVVGSGDKIIVPFKYDGLESLALRHDPKVSSLLIFTTDQKMGVVSLNGQVVVPAKYDRLYYSTEGFVGIDSNDYALLSFEGKKMLTSDHQFYPTEEGFFFWKDSTGLKAFDLYGRTAQYRQKPSYMSYQEFVDMIPVPEPVQESRIDEIYSTPDEPAEYPGGNKEMLSFLSKNIKYPAEAAELGIEGKCFLSFTVELDGSLTNIKVVRGVRDCPECDKEAIRVVKLMPKWKPGKLNGQTVRSTFTLPIRFMLQ